MTKILALDYAVNRYGKQIGQQAKNGTIALAKREKIPHSTWIRETVTVYNPYTNEVEKTLQSEESILRNGVLSKSKTVKNKEGQITDQYTKTFNPYWGTLENTHIKHNGDSTSKIRNILTVSKDSIGMATEKAKVIDSQTVPITNPVYTNFLIKNKNFKYKSDQYMPITANEYYTRLSEEINAKTN